MSFQDIGDGFYRVGSPQRSAITGRYARTMRNVDDEDLKEWAEGIWAAVEYRGNGLKAIKDFISWLELENN